MGNRTTHSYFKYGKRLLKANLVITLLTGFLLNTLSLGQFANIAAAAPSPEITGWEAYFGNNLENWIIEDTIIASANSQTSASLALKPDAPYPYGKISLKENLRFNMDDNPILKVFIPNNTGFYNIKVNDGTLPDDISLTEGDKSGTGMFEFNLKELTGWSGVKSFDLILYANNGSVTYENVQIVGAEVILPIGWEADFSNELARWTKDHDISAVANSQTSVTLALLPDASYPYGKISLKKNLTFNMNENPILKLKISSITGFFNVKINDGTLPTDISLTGGDIYGTGTFEFDLKKLTGWSGVKSFDLIFYTNNGTVTYENVQILGAEPIPFVGWEADFSNNLKKWTLDNALTASSDAATNVTLAVKPDAAYSHGQLALNAPLHFNINDNPIFKVSVPQATGQWNVMLSSDIDPNDISLTGGNVSATGEFLYDIKSITEWSGEKNFTIKLIAVDGSVTFSTVQILEAEQIEGQTPDVAVDATVPTSASLIETGPGQRRDISLPNSKLVINPFDFKISSVVTSSDYSNRPTLPLNLGYLNGATARKDRFLSNALMLHKPRENAAEGIDVGAVLNLSDANYWNIGMPGEYDPGDLTTTFSPSGLTMEVSPSADPYWQAIYTKNPVTVNIDATPWVEVSVPQLDGGWSLKVKDGKGIEYILVADTDKSGDFLVNLKDKTFLSGEQNLTFYIFSIGKGESTTISNLRIVAINEQLEGADSFSTSWTPHNLPFEAEYSDGSTLEGTDFMYDVNTVVRMVDYSNISPSNGQYYLTGKYPGSASWDAVNHVLTITSSAYQYAIKTNTTQPSVSFYANETDMLTNRNRLETASSNGGTWSIAFNANDLPNHQLIASVAFATSSESSELLNRVNAPFTAKLENKLNEREQFWDDYLLKVPRPERFDIQMIKRRGITSEAVKHEYYVAWVFTAQNVLPTDESVQFSYPQMATGKPSMWDEGAPEAPFSASWESFLGIQIYAYIDPDAAWEMLLGLMSLVDEEGLLGGESLPSRKAQTAAILFELTGDKDRLELVYPGLARYMDWRIANPRWIMGSINNPNQKDAEFVVSALLDIKYMEKIAKCLEKTTEAQQWEDKYDALFEDYLSWYWVKPTSIPYQNYYADTGARAGGSGLIAVTTGLYLENLEGPYLTSMMRLFDSVYKPNKLFAGVGSKQPDYDLTTYGLIHKGYYDRAITMVESAMRDVSLIANSLGMFSELYSSKEYLPVGVRPSLFGTVQIIQNVLLRNGFTYDKGAPHSVRLFEDSYGVSNLKVKDKILNISFDKATDEMIASGSYINGTVTRATEIGDVVNLSELVIPTTPIDPGNGGGSNVGGDNKNDQYDSVSIENGIAIVKSKDSATGVTIRLQDVGNHPLQVELGKVLLQLNSELIARLAAQDAEEEATALEITITPNTDTKILQALEQEMQAGSPFYDISIRLKTKDNRNVSIQQIHGDITVWLPYKSDAANEELLGIYYYNPARQAWEYVRGKGDQSSKYMTAYLEHLGSYAVLAYNKTFSDVPSNHWALHAIKVLAAKHIVQGVNAAIFRPSGKITRAEFTAMLVRTLQLDDASGTTELFKDMDPNAWYADYIASAYAAGLVKGTSSSTFNPNGIITREQMAALLVRAYEYQTNISLTKVEVTEMELFKDIYNVSAWAKPFLSQATSLGLMKGKGNQLFDPKSDVSRAESAQAIYNLIK